MSSSLAGVLGVLSLTLQANAQVTQTGDLKKWHAVTLTFDGPSASESGTPNPFTDYRMNVTFSQGSTSLLVPGFFAADGNAANSGATSGTKWRVHFAPPSTGVWNYTVSFRQGTNIAASTNVSDGTAVTPIDGVSGSITIANTDKGGRDFRGKGMLRYVGKHYPQFDNGEYFIKVGPGDPENFLGYSDFDNTPSGSYGIHSYNAHVGNWQTGDPLWGGTRGKGIVGVVNYLTGLGVNTLYFILWCGGDSKNVYPWTGATNYLQYDCSKCDQWDIVFSHMTARGMHLHAFFNEEECDMRLDGGGDLGIQHKVYYREMIARFGHQNALTWDLGEEISIAPGPSSAQLKNYCDYIKQIDPYDHQIGAHPGPISSLYTPLLAYPTFDCADMQTGGSLDEVHPATIEWVDKSAAAGHKWLVSNDEQGGSGQGVDPNAGRMDEYRKKVLWANLTAGGWGVEYYLGPEGLTTDDWTGYAQAWREEGYAASFFKSNVRFQDMVHSDNLVGAGNWCLGLKDTMYVVYLPNGGATNLNLTGVTGTYSVKWFDPRNGGALANGTVQTVNGGGPVSIGQASGNTASDWAALITRVGFVSNHPQKPDASPLSRDGIRVSQTANGLALANLIGTARISILNADGRTIASLQVNAATSGTANLDLRGCGTGIRFLVIERQAAKITNRIVVGR
jgi:hypothetical protein